MTGIERWRMGHGIREGEPWSVIDGPAMAAPVDVVRATDYDALAEQLRGAVEAIKALSDRVRPDDADAREAAYGRGYQAAVADALEVPVRGR